MAQLFLNPAEVPSTSRTERLHQRHKREDQIHRPNAQQDE